MKKLILAFVFILLFVCPKAMAQPNIILVVLDDVTAEWVEPYDVTGSITGIDTPNLETMADEGIHITRFFAERTCTPSRQSLMTGMDLRGHGDRSATNRHGLLHPGNTFVSVLKDNGYSTAIVGKWHLSPFNRDDNSPIMTQQVRAAGFETGYIVGQQIDITDATQIDDTKNDYASFVWCDVDADTCTVPDNTLNDKYLTEMITDETVSLISSLTEPWFIYVPHRTPHTEIHMPPTGDFNTSTVCNTTAMTTSECHWPNAIAASGGLCDPTPAEFWGCYNAMVSAGDVSIGEIVTAMDAHDSNTIIMVTADNGSTPQQAQINGDPTIQGSWSSSHMKGSAAYGQWVPFIAKGVNITSNGSPDTYETLDITAEITDIGATILEAAGVTNTMNVSYEPSSRLPSYGTRRPYRGISFWMNMKIGSSAPTRKNCSVRHRSWFPVLGSTIGSKVGVIGENYLLYTNTADVRDVGEDAIEFATSIGATYWPYVHQYNRDTLVQVFDERLDTGSLTAAQQIVYDDYTDIVAKSLDPTDYYKYSFCE